MHVYTHRYTSLVFFSHGEINIYSTLPKVTNTWVNSMNILGLYKMIDIVIANPKANYRRHGFYFLFFVVEKSKTIIKFNL